MTTTVVGALVLASCGGGGSSEADADTTVTTAVTTAAGADDAAPMDRPEVCEARANLILAATAVTGETDPAVIDPALDVMSGALTVLESAVLKHPELVADAAALKGVVDAAAVAIEPGMAPAQLEALALDARFADPVALEAAQRIAHYPLRCAEDDA